MKKIFIGNRKGEKVCVVVEISNPQMGLVFVMHGLGGFKEQILLLAISETFSKNNYTVVRFDTTNSFGESDGDYKSATATNYFQDLEDVILWAINQPWYQEQFVLTGHSLGSFCVALYAENHPEQVKALAPISTVVSGKLSNEAHQKYEPKIFKKWQETGWQEKPSVSIPGLIKTLPWSFQEDLQKYNLLPNISKLTMPVLLIVGENDTSTPPEQQKLLFGQLPGKKELHFIKEAQHGFDKPKQLSELQKILKNWVEKID